MAPLGQTSHSQSIGGRWSEEGVEPWEPAFWQGHIPAATWAAQLTTAPSSLSVLDAQHSARERVSAEAGESACHN